MLGVAAGASLAGALLKRRRPAPRGETRRGADLASRRRCSRCAAASWPQYHGVEHKAIAAYEQGTADAGDADKEHERCGSHLVAPMLASNLAGTLLLRRALERPGPLAGGAVALASTAVAVEVFAWCERHAATRAGARAPRRPASRSSARSARASPTSASSRSAAPRWRRSCGPRASRLWQRRIQLLEREPIELRVPACCMGRRSRLGRAGMQVTAAPTPQAVRPAAPVIPALVRLGASSRTRSSPGPRSSSWACSSSSSGAR